MGVTVATLTFVSAPSLVAQTIVVHPPSVSVQTPPPPPVAPGVSVEIGVPDNYVWDGQEYVGVIGDQYYYLAPGDVWMPMPQARIVFFHDWETHHHDWREHAIVNEKYRYDAHHKEHPYKGHQDHDSDHHDRDHDHN